LTIYDPVIGDEEQNIIAGTKFEDLPSNYLCPLCESEKDNFIEVEEISLSKV
jgi:rubredoxin